LAAILVIAIVVVFNAKMATPVSAKEILDHAYAVQAAYTPTQGIDHILGVMYTSMQASAEGLRPL